MSHYPGGRGVEEPPLFPLIPDNEKVGLGVDGEMGTGGGGSGLASRRGSASMSLGGLGMNGGKGKAKGGRIGGFGLSGVSGKLTSLIRVITEGLDGRCGNHWPDTLLKTLIP
jgi:hypothetical protein